MSAEQEGRVEAENYRSAHHLGTQPLADLIALIDLVEGVDVAVIRSPADDAHGITVLDPDTRTTMLVAVATPNPTRLRSTIAHELAHHLFDDSAPDGNDWDVRPHEESRATAFARHLLFPLSAITDVLGPPDSARPVTESDVSSLVQRFALSPQMVAIQLCGARYISDEQKSAWMSLTAPRLATRYGWSNLYAAWKADSEAVRPPQRLLARAVDGYTSGIVSINTIARLEDITVDEAEAALDEAELVPKPPVAVPINETRLPGHESSEALDAFDAEFGADG